MADVPIRASRSASRQRRRPLPYPLRRLLQALPLVVTIAVLNFFWLRLAPGDLADVMAGEAGAATPEYLAALRHQFGTDQPLALQFLAYLDRMAHLDLGWSFRYNESVLRLILERLPATALLMVGALVIALLFGCVAGTVAAVSRRRSIDIAISILATLGFATPLFWLGLMLMVLFSAHLHWLPAGGITTPGLAATGWTRVGDIAAHMALPVFCLAAYYLAIYARLMRASVLEVAGLDFVRTARAKGLSRAATIRAHVVPNALLPIVTMTALQFGTLFSGSVAIETVFSWPGLGQLALDAVASRDLNLLLGILLFSSVLVLIVNLAMGLAYGWFDPRIEEQR
ncbi:binding-protein-dependent transport systems inner membrane component [Paraburkholderia atlantica]|uniref:Binding-protein-dependent transport systems inner membrane component n=1 Tax=Paraburkholderia atlantica TaxID=2654982 RepID=D5WK21_PARAM|nr:ABC transporter permease [Paraburkholderia atlantica]ADG19567.1 binding-protein-dependent transport systems inner membrane component [Paraburkholderia atlantica]